MPSPSLPTLLVTAGYPPFQEEAEARTAQEAVSRCRAHGHPVEVIAPSPDHEEFIHLGPAGERVHRVTLGRSYLLKPLRSWAQALRPGPWRVGFGLRAAERALELRTLWTWRFGSVVLSPGLRSLPLLRTSLAWGAPLADRLPEPGPPASEKSPADEVRSVDLICCTYNREDDLVSSLPSLLEGARAGRDAGLDVRLTVVFQNEGLPARLRARGLPALEREVTFVPCFPPGLTRARNAGLAATTGELVIFVDDDVRLEPGYVLEYVGAANRAPEACGVAGRILSRVEGARRTWHRSVGQIRSSGHVEANFDSYCDDVPLVPMTPRGASMGYRRRAVDALLGPRWFDESLTGSAHREETTLALRLFRAGRSFVYAPRAGLLHLESTTGGCENRESLTPERRRRTYVLEHRFLNRLYAPLGSLGRLPPLLQVPREVRLMSVSGRPRPSLSEMLETTRLELGAYFDAVRASPDR